MTQHNSFSLFFQPSHIVGNLHVHILSVLFLCICLLCVVVVVVVDPLLPDYWGESASVV